MADGTYEMHLRIRAQSCGVEGCERSGKEIVTRNPNGLTVIRRCPDHLDSAQVGMDSLTELKPAPRSIHELLAMPTRNGG